jgi:hypothetical protein
MKNTQAALSRTSVNESLLSLALLAAVLFFTTAPRIQAEDRDRCQRRVVHAEHELHEAIEKHGRNSKRANHERRELHCSDCVREDHAVPDHAVFRCDIRQNQRRLRNGAAGCMMRLLHWHAHGADVKFANLWDMNFRFHHCFHDCDSTGRIDLIPRATVGLDMNIDCAEYTPAAVKVLR